MRFRIIWAILALVMAVPSTLLGQAVVVNPPKTLCPCPDTTKKVVPKPKAVSKPVALKRLAPPAVIVRKPDTAQTKTTVSVNPVVVSTPDTMKVKVFGKVELELSDADRTAMMESQKRIFVGEGRHQRGWWSRNWGWPVGAAILGTAVGIAGNELGWWDGRKITQCTIIGSGTCPR